MTWNHVERARLSLDPAGGANTASIGGQPLDRQHRVGSPAKGVVPSAHRRGACVVSLSREGHQQAIDAGDPGHDAQWNAGVLQDRPLLDVKLHEGAHVGGRPGSFVDAVRIAAARGQRLRERATVRILQREVLTCERACNRAAADAADAEIIGLLAEEVHDPQLMTKAQAAVPNAAGGFDRTEDADRAVEPPAAGDAVGVGTGDQGWTVAGTKRADEIATGVEPHLQPSVAHRGCNPLARAYIRLGEHPPCPAWAVRFAEVGELLQVGLKSPEIDGRYADQLPPSTSTALIKSTPMICSTSASATRSRVLEDSGSLSRWMWKTAI